VDPRLHLPIRQALAVTTAAAHPAAARRFVAYAAGDAGRAVLRRYGFAIPGVDAEAGGAAGGAARDPAPNGARDTTRR
jgi:ABC-type Fe3+ transport system substrate-binding protein